MPVTEGTMRSTDSRRTYLCLLAALFFTAIAIPCIGWAQGSRTAQYHLVKKVVLGGEGGWDYFTADPATHKIFIARGSYVMVLGPDGKVTAQMDVGRDNEAHAVAFAPDLNRAFTSNGGGSSVTIFDPRTLEVARDVSIPGRDTDDILYEPVSKRVFTFNGRKANDATAVDAVAGVVVGNIPLDGKPETAQADGQGHIYVNIEDKSELREIDAKSLKVMQSWPLAPCKNPSGMAVDNEYSLLIIGCHNGLMEFWDYANAKVAGTVPIGSGIDANRFDRE